ncbi:DUF5317 domain-containing protein [Aquibacillus sediminis]|uniref:DUF5317 domain-containing protein n=1 Tax=Aquibacillus sediminis TaxID=2574734 RepID=UPI001107C21B|nr:DUF5317 domain-containing protein [Aquibacillus sediminis]
MVLDGIVISLVVGFLRKGSLKGFMYPIFSFGWVFPILLFLQLTFFYYQNESGLIAVLSNYMYIFIYLLGLFFLWMNRHLKGFNMVFIGVFLNFLVMFINGGRMPVSEEASVILDPLYIEAMKEGLYGKHAMLTESTRLPFLGDIIPITSPYPKSQVISIGDVIMNIGIFLFIQDRMIHKKAQQQGDITTNVQAQETEVIK